MHHAHITHATHTTRVPAPRRTRSTTAARRAAGLMPKAWQRTRQTTHGDGTKAWQRPCGWNAAGGGVAKRELLEDAEEQRSERSNFWIEICRAENAASDAAFDAQESAYEAFLDEGEDQAAAAWVSDDDVFDGHYSDY